jgi:hypothetical protein
MQAIPSLDPLATILGHHTAMNIAKQSRMSHEDLAREIEKIDLATDLLKTESTDPWPVMDKAAFHGLIGAFTRAVEPFSEADPVGILLHTLIVGGCLVGPGPHVLVEHAPHHSRLNGVLVGKTSGGRKGTAWSQPRYLFSHVDEEWVKTRVRSGLSSGEGLIYAVRDPDGDDPGEPDKRLFVIETEFASALMAMERQGNILSPKIRDAWDHGYLGPMTKRDRLTATGAHICIIGHISQEELLRSLTSTERVNGFANRFLFALVKQSKLIPSGKGAPAEVMEPYFIRFRRTLERARTRGETARESEAENLWAAVYPKLVEEIPGLTGAILARGAAQVLRLSLTYSLLDEAEASRPRPAIRVSHLLAAIAVWDYCKASVFQIFGDAVGDPVADRLLRAIKKGPQTDTELYEVLGKRDGGRKDPALDLLLRLDRVHWTRTPTAGRPVREWHAGTHERCKLCVKRV